MNNKIIYLIYKVYNHISGAMNKKTMVIYGWTYSKSVMKTFFAQRDNKKYIFKKIYEEELGEYNKYSGKIISLNSKDDMIDYIKLKSVATQEYVLFLTTANELIQTEKNIYRMFENQCAIGNIFDTNVNKDDMYYLTIFNNFKSCYADALYDLGFRPPEMNSLYSHYSDEHDSDICELIDRSYDSSLHRYHRSHEPLGAVSDDIFTKILYSLEAFIKVLRDDL